MKIEIYSDFACPYCYIGKRHLEQALKEMNLTEKTTVLHRAFILDPGKISHPERTFKEGLNLQTVEEQKRIDDLFASITKLAAKIGLSYHMDGIKDIATEKAHRLTLWVQDLKPALTQQVIDAIFHAHFIDNRDISDTSVLLDVIKDLPLDSQAAQGILDDPKAYLDQLFADDEKAHALDVDYIPYFVVNDDDRISGVVNTEKLKNILARNIASSDQ